MPSRLRTAIAGARVRTICCLGAIWLLGLHAEGVRRWRDCEEEGGSRGMRRCGTRSCKRNTSAAGAYPAGCWPMDLIAFTVETAGTINPPTAGPPTVARGRACCCATDVNTMCMHHVVLASNAACILMYGSRHTRADMQRGSGWGCLATGSGSGKECDCGPGS